MSNHVLVVLRICSCYAAHSAVLLKAESVVDKVEWINKLKSIATLKTGQGMGEHGLSIRQSHSDGSLVSVSLFLGFVLAAYMV